MGRKYKFHDDEHLYFVTFTVIDWVDTFIRDEYRNIFYESVTYCQKNKGLQVFAYCIMTSHIHLVIGVVDNKISDVVRDLKSFTSRSIRKAIDNGDFESRKKWMMNRFKFRGKFNSNNIDYQFWMQNNHPIILDTNEKLDQRINYIHQNPVKAGFVEKAEDWLHSSAADYFEIRQGQISIEKIS